MTGELIWQTKVDDHPNATVTGTPTLGGSVTMTVTGATGLPFVNVGLAPTVPLLAPACPCLVLDGQSWVFGGSLTVTAPLDPALTGLPIKSQGVDMLTSAPTCTFAGVDMAFTDVWTITIG